MNGRRIQGHQVGGISMRLTDTTPDSKEDYEEAVSSHFKLQVPVVLYVGGGEGREWNGRSVNRFRCSRWYMMPT